MHIGCFIGGGAEPFQGVGLKQNEILPVRCCVRAHMAVKPPAFAAVAVNHIHQGLIYLEPDPAAKASARRNRSLLVRISIHFYLRLKRHYSP